MTVRKFLDLSTAHLSLATRAWLDSEGVIAASVRTSNDPEPALMMGSTPYGWFVYSDPESCNDPAGLATLLDQRNSLNNSFGHGAYQDGITRSRIEKIDDQARAYIGEGGKLMPSDLWKCMAYALAFGCDYVLFDADAPTLDCLPIFEEPEPPAVTAERPSTGLH